MTRFQSISLSLHHDLLATIVIAILGGLITSRKALDGLEYTSVVFIAGIVSILGFVYGIGFGVLSACLTFVVQSSRQSSIRAVFSGTFTHCMSILDDLI